MSEARITPYQIYSQPAYVTTLHTDNGDLTTDDIGTLAGTVKKGY